MELHDRIKLIRKHFRLTQDEFGKVLGVSRDVIGNIELNRLSKPEAKEPIIKLICKEFSVDYIWLTTGEGTMFSENDDDTMELIDRIMTGENEFHKNLFKTFARFDEADLKALEHLIDKFIEAKKAD